jgi:hypothetical protein
MAASVCSQPACWTTPGFCLGAGLYHGCGGKHHSQWHGALVVEDEHFSDCSSLQSVVQLLFEGMLASR